MQVVELSGNCPESFETSGTKRNDLEELEAQPWGKALCRCENFGIPVAAARERISP